MRRIAPQGRTYPVSYTHLDVYKRQAQQQETTGESPELGGDAKAIENSQNPAVEIAENISGSVVGITAYTKQLVSGQEPVEQALDAGTGFVISDDGYILTNNHVVADGNLIKVTTPDGQEHCLLYTSRWV